MKRRHFVRRHGSTIKTTGIQATGGAALAFLDRNVLSSESVSKTIGTNTYIKPILAIAVAHFIKSKAPNLGAGMAGAAGYMLVETYYSQPVTAAKVPPAAPAPAPGGPVAGLVDAAPMNAFGPGGMNGQYVDAGALVYEVPAG